MTDLRYWTGTCSVVQDGTAVTFSSAQMLQYAVVGDHIAINRAPSVEVVSVDGQLQLGIEPWAGATLLNVNYVLYRDSILRASRGQLATDISKLNASLNRSGYYYFVADTLTEPDPSDGDEGQYAQQESTGKRWLKTGGVWVYKGIYAIFKMAGNWDATVSYDTSVITQRSGKLWLARQSGNLNHPPETSPLWWSLFLSGGDAYDVVTFDTDRPASGELVLKLCMTKSVIFYAGLVDSKASADIGATSAAVYSYRRNGVQFATLTFAAGGQGGPQSGVFTSGVDTTFAAGDVLTIIAPAARDATLTSVGATLSGYRN